MGCKLIHNKDATVSKVCLESERSLVLDLIQGHAKSNVRDWWTVLELVDVVGHHWGKGGEREEESQGTSDGAWLH